MSEKYHSFFHSPKQVISKFAERNNQQFSSTGDNFLLSFFVYFCGFFFSYLIYAFTCRFHFILTFPFLIG